MKKGVVIILVFISLISVAYSQQPDIARFIPQPLELNPAYAGSYQQYRGNIYYRTQWIGFEDHPETFKLSAEVPFTKINSGVGLFYSSDHNGPINSTIYNLNYSYNFRLNKFNLQIGTGLNYNRFKIELSNIESTEGYDPIINHYDKKFDRLALLGGVFLYNNEFYISLSYRDVFIYANDDELKYNKEYLNLITGYHFFKGRYISICPSIKMNSNFEKLSRPGLNLTTVLINKFWFSLTYEEYDYLTLGIGIDIWKCHGGVRYSNEINGKYSFTNTSYGMFEITTGFYFDKN